MNRRRLIAGAASAVAAVAAVAGVAGVGAARVARAQTGVTLKFHTFVPPLSNAWLLMHKPWMDRVTKASGGRIQFEGYPAMQFGGSPAQLYDQARDGVVDIVWTLPGHTAGRFPRTEVFELPFMMNHAEATSRACWEYVQTECADEFAQTQVLALHVHGPGLFHSARKAIREPGDLRGLKVRSPTRQVSRLLASMGAVPVDLPLPVVADALGQGDIDACVIPWEAVPSAKVHELARFHTEFDPAGPALYTTTFVLAMNKARYDALAPDLRDVIDAHAGPAASAWLGRIQQANDPLGRQAAQERGNTIHQVPAAVREQFVRLCAAVEDQWLKDVQGRGFDGRKLLARARALIAKHT